jgi:glycosyltransferase involved in cell wall biosynthesis
MNRGGLETMLMNYYRKLDRNKVQFDFLVHRKEAGDYEKEILELGGRIFRVPNLNPLSINYYRELNKFFKYHKYKVVHCHLGCMSAFPLRIAKKYGVQIRIAHSHSKSQDMDWKYPIKLLSRYLIPRYTTHFFSCGEEAGKWVFRNRSFEIIKNAIDVEKFQYNIEEREEMRRKLQVEDHVILGHVGRFSPAKNHAYLIDIFEAYSKKNPSAILWLIGEGNGKAAVQRTVKERGLEGKVTFWGSRTDVDCFYQSMDVFVFPSKYEGLPVTMVEAQTSGLPCIISDKVPKECIVTNLVQQVPLEGALKMWENAIDRAIKMKRQNTAEQIKEAGFDVSENVLKLQELYCTSMAEE